MQNGLPAREAVFALEESRFQSILDMVEGYPDRGNMRIIDIEEVRANLEQLINEVKPGEWFAVSVDGKPKVKVAALFPEGIEQLKKGGSAV